MYYIIILNNSYMTEYTINSPQPREKIKKNSIEHSGHLIKKKSVLTDGLLAQTINPLKIYFRKE